VHVQEGREKEEERVKENRGGKKKWEYKKGRPNKGEKINHLVHSLRWLRPGQREEIYQPAQCNA